MPQFNQAPRQEANVETLADVDARIEELRKDLTKTQDEIKELKEKQVPVPANLLNKEKLLITFLAEETKKQIQLMLKGNTPELELEKDRKYEVLPALDDPWKDVERRANKTNKRPDDFEKTSANDRNFKGNNDNWSHVGKTGR
jgi:hypothetical protein